MSKRIERASLAPATLSGLVGFNAQPSQSGYDPVARALSVRSLVVDEQEIPVPPQAMLTRLKEIDDRLGLRWVTDRMAWGYTWTWHPDDKRRVLIQTGRMSPSDDFDVIGWLEPGTGVDEAYGNFVRSVKRFSGKRDDINWLLARIEAHNEQQWRKNVEPVMDYANEMISTNARSLFKNMGRSIAKVWQSVPKHLPKRKTEDAFK